MLGIHQWRYGAFCVSRQHRLRRQWPRRILMCLFIVCESKFTIGESRTISHANDTQAQQVTPNPRPGRFSTETPLERERRLQIRREQRRRKRQQDNKRQRNRRLESEALWSFYTVENPDFLVCRFPRRYIDQILFQLCITARRIIIFRRTAPGHICSLFLSFSKSGRRNNATSAFQYTVNNNTT